MADPSMSSLPYLTRALPGTGGVIRSVHEDFVVEELPRYEPADEGTHLFIEIEKRGITTLEATRRLGRALQIAPREIGYAGMKDAQGVTRQVLSVEHVDPQRVAELQLADMRILLIRRHANKLRLGHLAGNRFRLKIRGTVVAPLAQARPILEVLSAKGVPNYFGPQRFGNRGTNAAVGRAVLRGDYAEAIGLVAGRPAAGDREDERRARELFDAGRFEEAVSAWPPGCQQEARLCRALVRANGDPERAWRQVDMAMRRLFLSALQSELFNRVAAFRIDSLDRLHDGDLAWKHRNGACFRVEDAAAEQPRCDAFEISPTGPMFGAKMTEPSGAPGEMERQVLRDAGVAFDRRRSPDGIRLEGARRPLRAPVGEMAAAEGEDEMGPFLELRFALPPGSYATAVVREICKIGGDDSAAATDQAP